MKSAKDEHFIRSESFKIVPYLIVEISSQHVGKKLQSASAVGPKSAETLTQKLTSANGGHPHITYMVLIMIQGPSREQEVLRPSLSTRL